MAGTQQRQVTGPLFELTYPSFTGSLDEGETMTIRDNPPKGEWSVGLELMNSR